MSAAAATLSRLKMVTLPMSVMRALSLRLHKQFHQVLPMRAALMAMMRRETHHDGTRLMSGEREVVGYGVNGNPIYIDCVEFPFPAIRYREVTPELCAVREKELGNWNALSLQDNKLLYRHSFCQTYAEIQHFAPDWKLVIGVGLWSAAVGLLISLSYYFKLYDPVPETYAEDRRQSQLRRIIQLQMNPITGLSSKWC